MKMFTDIPPNISHHTRNLKPSKERVNSSDCGVDPYIPCEQSSVGVQTIKKIDRQTNTEKSNAYSHITLLPLPPKSDLSFLRNISERMLRELHRRPHLDAFKRLETNQAPSFQNEEGRVNYKYSLIWRKSIGVDAKANEIGRSVSGISWSANGKLLAVIYDTKDFSDDLDKLSSKFLSVGAIAIWDIYEINKSLASQTKYESVLDNLPHQPSCTAEHESPLICITAHPENSNIFAAGSSDGEVLLFDFSSSQKLIACSEIGTYFHQEAVSSLCWKYDSRQHEWLLCSVSGDGKVLFWNISNKLKFPAAGICLTKLMNRESPQTILIGASALGIPPFSSQYSDNIYVGSEGGHILKLHYSESSASTIRQIKDKITMKWSTNALKSISCVKNADQKDIIKSIEQTAKLKRKRGIDSYSVHEAKVPIHKLYPSATEFSYEPHLGLIRNIDMNPFDSNIFLSCDTNGELRLYSNFQKHPVFTVEPPLTNHSLTNHSNCYGLFDGKFSKSKPTVFATASEDGYIYIFDICKSTQLPVETLLAPRSNMNNFAKVKAIAFNHKEKEMFVSGDDTGKINLWQLPNNLINDDCDGFHILKKICSS